MVFEKFMPVYINHSFLISRVPNVHLGIASGILPAGTLVQCPASHNGQVESFN